MPGILFAVMAVFDLASPPRAQACDPPRPGDVNKREVTPNDGQTGVPTNARVTVQYVTTSGVTDHLKLQSSDGVPVPVSISQTYSPYILTPVEALQPNTTYQVLSDLAKVPCVQGMPYGTSSPTCLQSVDGGVADGGSSSDGGSSKPSFVIAAFTTGAGPDTTPPVLSGILNYTTMPESCAGGNCCVDYTGVAILFGWNGASDDMGIDHYEISNLDGSGADRPSGPAVRGLVICTRDSSTYPMQPLGSFIGTAGTYQVVAVDLAGNRSAPISAFVPIDCPALDAGSDGRNAIQGVDSAVQAEGPSPAPLDAAPFDAGVDIAVDIAMAATDAAHADVASAQGTDPTNAGGCSCRLKGGRQDATGLLLVSAGLLLALRRRRRSS